MINLDPIWIAEVQQQNFRQLLDAMSRPGNIYDIIVSSEQGMKALPVLACLLDAEVSLSDPHKLLSNHDWPLLQAKSSSVDKADYILCNSQNSPDFIPKLGSLTSPEQSATLIMLVDKLGQGDTRIRLTGPGIKNTLNVRLQGLDQQWFVLRNEWVSSLSLGVDMILIDEKQLIALPRTTKLELF